MKKSKSKRSQAGKSQDISRAVMLGARFARLGLRAGILLSKRALVRGHKSLSYAARRTHKIARRVLHA